MAGGGWAARDVSTLRVRGTVLACPVAAPDAAERAVLEALSRGKTDKALRKLASLRLSSSPHPNLPILAALTDFASGADLGGAALLALLDDDIPSHLQIRAELTALAGDRCRAASLYAGLPASMTESLRLRPRSDALERECLDAFARRVEARWSEGDFNGMEALLEDLPANLRRDPRAARAAFPAAVLAGDASQARLLLDRLSPGDREHWAVMVSALELEPSLRLSYLKAGGPGLINDPLGGELYARALDEWLVGNMPGDFRLAWESPAVTQRDLALLLCLHFPGLRGGAVPGAELPETVLGDPQADCLAPLLSQGFLPAYEPEAAVPSDAAIRALTRALEQAGLMAPCGPGREEWVRCGLLPDRWGEGPLSGRQWSALAHRVRGDLP